MQQSSWLAYLVKAAPHWYAHADHLFRHEWQRGPDGKLLCLAGLVGLAGLVYVPMIWIPLRLSAARRRKQEQATLSARPGNKPSRRSELGAREFDPFRTFEQMEDKSLDELKAEAEREAALADAEEQVALHRERRLKARQSIAEASLSSLTANLEAQGAASRGAVGGAVMDAVRGNPGPFAPPPIGPGTSHAIPAVPQTLPAPQTVLSAASTQASMPVEPVLSSDELESVLVLAAAECGADDALWMEWAVLVSKRYPAQALDIIAAASRFRQGAAQQSPRRPAPKPAASGRNGTA